MTFELPDAIVRDAVPDDDIVLAYVTRGALAKYVEGVAARNDAFRDELEACIDGLEEAGEPISAVAREWRRPGNAVVPIASARPRKPRRLPRWTLVLAAALLLFPAIVFLQSRDEAARVEARKDQEIREKNAELQRLMAELKAQQETMQMAQAELANAKSDTDRAEAQAKLVAAQEQQRKTQASVRSVGAGTKTNAGTKAACACQAGDPLCSCVP